MFDEFKELLSGFNARNVKYLMVGAYAVSLHAQPRATKGIGIFIKPDAANAQALYAALADFGAPLEGLTASDFTHPDKFFRIGRSPLAIDTIPQIPGLEFDRAWQNRAEELIDPKTGLTAFYVSSEDLIAAKLASGRPQDIADVAALRQAARNKK